MLHSKINYKESDFPFFFCFLQLSRHCLSWHSSDCNCNIYVSCSVIKDEKQHLCLRKQLVVFYLQSRPKAENRKYASYPSVRVVSDQSRFITTAKVVTTRLIKILIISLYGESVKCSSNSSDDDLVPAAITIVDNYEEVICLRAPSGLQKPEDIPRIFATLEREII